MDMYICLHVIISEVSRAITSALPGDTYLPTSMEMYICLRVIFCEVSKAITFALLSDTSRIQVWMCTYVYMRSSVRCPRLSLLHSQVIYMCTYIWIHLCIFLHMIFSEVSGAITVALLGDLYMHICIYMYICLHVICSDMSGAMSVALQVYIYCMNICIRAYVYM